MMNPNSKPTVGVSYAWKEESSGTHRQAVEGFCTRLRKRGVDVIRDKDWLEPGQSITGFMHKLGTTDGMAHLCVFLSETYLKSPYCMYELLVAWQRSVGAPEDFRKRVKVWVMPGTSVFDTESRRAVTDHWFEVKERSEKVLRDSVGRGLAAGEVELHERVVDIANSINKILVFVADAVSPASGDEFGQWIDRQFPALESSADGRQRQIPPPPLGPEENAYPDLVGKMNAWLRSADRVTAFVSDHAPGWFQRTGSSVQLVKDAGRIRLDLYGPLKAYVKHWEDAKPDQSFVGAFKRIVSGMLVLAVDPAWIVQERRFTPHDSLRFAGGTFDKKSGPKKGINCLVLLHRALAPGGAPCPLDELLVASHEPDAKRLPLVAQLPASPLKSEKAQEVMDDLRRVLHGIARVVQEGRDPEVVTQEIREQLLQQLERGCPWHSDDMSYLRYKQELELAGLIVEYADHRSSETEFLGKAHLLVEVIHDLNDLISFAK